MHITLNGETTQLPPTVRTVAELLTHVGMGAHKAAVERNRTLVPRAEHTTTTLAPNDVIELVHFIGGG